MKTDIQKAHLDCTSLEHPLHHIPIRPQHPRVMYTKSAIKQLLHLLIPRPANLPTEPPVHGMLRAQEIVTDAFLQRGLGEHHTRLDRVLAGVDEDHDLVALRDELGNFLEGDGVEVLARLRGAGLALDAEEVLFQGYWTEGGVEVEETFVFGDAV